MIPTDGANLLTLKNGRAQFEPNLDDDDDAFGTWGPSADRVRPVKGEEDKCERFGTGVVPAVGTPKLKSDKYGVNG